MRYEDENIWLTQKMMATVYDVSVPAINQHLKRIFADNELEEAAVIKQYLTTAERKLYQKITDIYAIPRWITIRAPRRPNAFLRRFRTADDAMYQAKKWAKDGS